jgi:hypothetical protein
VNAAIEAALQEFVLADNDLERLEAGLSEVNFFEAIGAVKSELRHSDFLAYLLNPQANHGLGDRFLRRFIQRAILDSNSPASALNALTLSVAEFAGSTVEREAEDIDILIVNAAHRLVIVIENKIGTGEHDDQLARYSARIKSRFPDYQALHLFLSVDGVEASHEDYIAMSYAKVCDVVEELLRTREASLYPDVAVLLRHYKILLRRHFMDEDELTQVARRIYAKHKVALDYIYEKRPDFQLAIKDLLEKHVSQQANLVLDLCTKSAVRFALDAWTEGKLTLGEGWTPSGRMLLFEFKISRERVVLGLFIGPGDTQVRESLFGFARDHRPPFKFADPKLYAKWNQIWSRKILGSADLESENLEAVNAKLAAAWNQFLTSELPLLAGAVAELRATGAV